MTNAALFNNHSYMNLVTFRKNGQPVTTPVWFALKDEKLYVYTGMESGKIKRIRNNGAVQVGPSNARGKPTGPVVNGQAHIVYGDQAQRAETMIAQKYGWQKKLIGFMNRFRKNMIEPAYIEIALSEDPPQRAPATAS